MKSGLSLEFKPEKVQAVHFTNQIKYKTNTTKHEDGEWCSIVHCVTLKEVQTSNVTHEASCLRACLHGEGDPGLVG